MHLYSFSKNTCVFFLLLFHFQLSFAASGTPTNEAFETANRLVAFEEFSSKPDLREITGDDIRLLSKNPVGEFLQAAFTRLDWEFKQSIENKKERTAFLKNTHFLMRLIQDIGRSEFHLGDGSQNSKTVGFKEQSIDHLEKILKTLDTYMYMYDFHEKMRKKILIVVEQVEANPGGPLLSSQELKQEIKKNKEEKKENRRYTEEDLVKNHTKKYEMSMERLDEIKATLEKNVIGQPELIDYYYDILFEQVVFGLGREKPSVAYKMGAPGNGKDTSAEALVDALFGEKNAYQKIENEGIPRLFRVPVITKDADIWSLIGSATGHVGSEDMSPFIRWLVKFSAGRYMIVEGEMTMAGKEPDRVLENPAWKPGMVLEGYYPPEMGVVYFNEFHNWSKKAKDLIFKQAVEKGYFKVNNPGPGGVSELYVPIHFDIATNEGLGLITSREVDGSINGEPKSYDEIKASWDIYAKDKQRLREEVLRTNEIDKTSSGDNQRGISEETLNRIPDEGLILMRPLSPKNLQKILEIKVNGLNKKLQAANGQLGKIEIQWSKSLIQEMQEYNYNAESNARPLEDRVMSFIKRSIYDAIKSGKIETDKKKKKYYLDIEFNEDKTSNLVFKDQESKEVLFKQLIKTTLSEKENKRISDSELAKIMSLGDRMKNHVFGVDPILDQIAEAILLAESDKTGLHSREKTKEAAKSFFLLGHTSTGKTETGKALAREFYTEGEAALVSIDFNQVSNSEDMKRLFYGYKDSAGRKIPSEFMKEYDKRNGRVVFQFEEIANLVLKGLGAELMSLYDILREPEVRSFIDNKPRPMKNVIILMSGNAGKEWYDDVPKDVPLMEQMEAMQRIYEKANKDVGFKQATLEKYFTEAFAARVGMHRTFFYPPLSFESLRKLTMLKLNQSIKSLRPKISAHGWNIVFDSKEDYMRMVEMIEKHGFNVRQQGASIDQYVNDIFAKKLKLALLKELPSGEEVRIRVPEDTSLEEVREYSLELISDASNRSLELKLPKRVYEREARTRNIDKILTAYHEVGHHIVRKVLLGNKYESELISIVPGVDNFGGRWLRYLGVAKSIDKEHMEYTRESIIHEIAVLLAGAKAQELVTKANRFDAGKSNDIARATMMAKRAILEFGLSEVWGNRVVSEEKLGELDEASKKLLSQEVSRFLKEGEVLAEKVILSNFTEIVAPLAVELSKKGTMEKKDFKAFYEDRESKIVYLGKLSPLKQSIMQMKSGFKKKLGALGNYFISRDHDADLKEGIPRPKDSEIANIEQIVKDRKAKETQGIEVSFNAPIYGMRALSCRTLFN